MLPAGIKAIRESIKVLAHQPGIGRPVEDMEPEYREWIIDFGDSGYMALYHYDGETALILAVRPERGWLLNSYTHAKAYSKSSRKPPPTKTFFIGSITILV